jgi:acetoin utilization protein AcuB
MKHPKRAITRDIRTRNPKRPARASRELEESSWPEGVVRVRDVMARPVVTFRQAMTAMRARNIRHAPVVDDTGRLVGMVSDRDLRTVILEPALRDAFEDLDRVLRSRTVKDVMTWGMVSVKPDTLLREAAGVIHANKIGAVPVVEHGRVVGMLAVGDVLKAVIQMLDEGVISRPGRWGAEA